jgi:hypothetical protein
MPKQAKAAPAPTPAPAKPDAGAVLNKAKAAFDQYRKKTAGTPSRSRKDDRHGPPHGFQPGTPFPAYPMPGWGAPPSPTQGAPWPGISWPTGGGPGPMPGPVATVAPIAEGVGQMLRVGVAFATAAFASGLQVVQGFAGPMGGHSAWAMNQPHSGCCQAESGCGCGDESCCDSGCQRSCCGDDECGDCCRVGVRNCRCCC